MIAPHNDVLVKVYASWSRASSELAKPYAQVAYYFDSKGESREQKLLVAVDVAKLLARLQRQLGEGFAHIHTRIVAARETPVAKDARLLDERRVWSLFVTSEHAVYAHH